MSRTFKEAIKHDDHDNDHELSKLQIKNIMM